MGTDKVGPTVTCRKPDRFRQWSFQIAGLVSFENFTSAYNTIYAQLYSDGTETIDLSIGVINVADIMGPDTLSHTKSLTDYCSSYRTYNPFVACCRRDVYQAIHSCICHTIRNASFIAISLFIISYTALSDSC